ncbi:MAG: DUF1223 domain-containing protein [Caulobacteraceae bacterium]
MSFGVAALSTTAEAARPSRAPPPVLVELFTAQGCASCPQADRVLAQIADRKGVLALTFPVDYWDYLGWRDTFAKPEFTDRQRAYVGRLKVREIYTPEVVVDGRQEAPGLDQDRIDTLIKGAQDDPQDPPAVRLSRNGARIQVSPAADHRSADVWLVRYDPQQQDVRVKSGDNKGKLVSQRNVVRELTKLGRISTRAHSFALPKAAQDGLKTVILVQGVRGGPILVARQAD